MFRVLILLTLVILQPALPVQSQSGGGGGGSNDFSPPSQSIGSGTDTADTTRLAEAQPDIVGGTPEELFDALGQIDEALKNLDDLKKLAEQLRRTTPDRELELRQFQTRLNQQRQKLEEKRAELEVMGAKLRGHAKALKQQEEMQKRMGLPGGFTGPPMMHGMMDGMGMMGGMGMEGGMMGGGAGFSTQLEMDMRAIPLMTAVPEKMLEMVKPLMGPMGSYTYDSRSRIIVLRGDPATLDRAQKFIEKLTDTYAQALAKKGEDPFAPENLESDEPTEKTQPIQIEALLLVGEKVDDMTGELRAESLPREALAIGLQPDDLKPFGQLDLLAIGPMVLQSMIHPGKGRSPIETQLGGYLLQMLIDGPVAEVQLQKAPPREGPRNIPGPRQVQTMLSNTISATMFDRPILVGSVSPENDATIILVIRLKRI